MRIGLSGRTTGKQRIENQARESERDGFSTLWYPGGGGGDPLTAIIHAGLATEHIDLGTAVLATYLCHPVVLAARAVAVAEALGAERFTLGIGPSHGPAMEGMYGVRYARPGQHTAEYLDVVRRQIRGEPVELAGEVLRVHVGGATAAPVAVPVLLGALGPRLLDLAGSAADGTVLWLANATAIASHVRPLVSAAAERAGRPAPRIVAGLPVAVHDDADAARAVIAKQLAIYGRLPNYQRILAHGGVDSPAAAAIVGDEATVTHQLEALEAAGATEIWADVVAIGEDRATSRERTMTLLRSLVSR